MKVYMYTLRWHNWHGELYFCLNEYMLSIVVNGYTLPLFYHLPKGNNFCDFLFAFMVDEALLKLDIPYLTTRKPNKA